MSGRMNNFLLARGIDPRQFAALLKAFLTSDLRGLHYAKATGTQAKHVISPLFFVVGQCLTLSAIASLVLFMRVEVFFYSFVNLSLGVVVLAATVLVEFQEVVMNPHDLEILGPRPITPRTYAAARFANLLFYVVLMFLALTIQPAIVGMGLRDAGLWYGPAYLVAAFTGSVAVVCIVILALAAIGNSETLEGWKTLFAWTQIVLILVAGYGAQMMFRDKLSRLEMWGAFPPDWIQYVPTTWLARFVEQASIAPTQVTLLVGGIMLLFSAICLAITITVVARLYQTMQPLTVSVRYRPMGDARLGGLAFGMGNRVGNGPEERAGFWLCGRLLWRDGNLRMRSLLPFSMPLAVTVLGIFTQQFANPMQVKDPALTMLPILAVYLIGLGVPHMIYNLTFNDDHLAAWLLRCAPMSRPVGLGLGVCKAIMFWVITPTCLALAGVAAWVWQDPLAGLLHGALAWAFAWVMALAALWLAVPDIPFSCPPDRGGSSGPVLMTVALSCVAMNLGALHYLFAGSVWFWLAAFIVVIAVTFPLHRKAEARFEHLVGGGA
ncbi:hypothetical protein C5Y97_28835 [Blastopirellula marina]|uniref:ABC-2 type transport system permease protein n=2 Tax=Blastopirellula marina TaxID=124 RepID=A0A2S8F501_9BACT|nr:hypothetical protein C5Y98_28820 [Blastopirellula marina]PTL41389.1 hypothetical protein C5Y97_28835 [Blastopirellula marina]